MRSLDEKMMKALQIPLFHSQVVESEAGPFKGLSTLCQSLHSFRLPNVIYHLTHRKSVHAAESLFSPFSLTHGRCCHSCFHFLRQDPFTDTDTETHDTREERGRTNRQTREQRQVGAESRVKKIDFWRDARVRQTDLLHKTSSQCS